MADLSRSQGNPYRSSHYQEMLTRMHASCIAAEFGERLINHHEAVARTVASLFDGTPGYQASTRGPVFTIDGVPYRWTLTLTRDPAP
jgi:hypothetical protein